MRFDAVVLILALINDWRRRRRRNLLGVQLLSDKKIWEIDNGISVNLAIHAAYFNVSQCQCQTGQYRTMQDGARQGRRAQDCSRSAGQWTVQDNTRQCRTVYDSESQCMIVQDKAKQHRAVKDSTGQWRTLQDCERLYRTMQYKYWWSSRVGKAFKNDLLTDFKSTSERFPSVRFWSLRF